VVALVVVHLAELQHLETMEIHHQYLVVDLPQFPVQQAEEAALTKEQMVRTAALAVVVQDTKIQLLALELLEKETTVEAVTAAAKAAAVAVAKVPLEAMVLEVVVTAAQVQHLQSLEHQQTMLVVVVEVLEAVPKVQVVLVAEALLEVLQELLVVQTQVAVVEELVRIPLTLEMVAAELLLLAPQQLLFQQQALRLKHSLEQTISIDSLAAGV